MVCLRNDNFTCARQVVNSFSASLVKFSLAVVPEWTDATSGKDPASIAPTLVPRISNLLLRHVDIVRQFTDQSAHARWSSSASGACFGNATNNSNWAGSMHAQSRRFDRDHVDLVNERETAAGRDVFKLHMRGLLECVMTYVFGAVVGDNRTCIGSGVACCRQCDGDRCTCRPVKKEYERMKQVLTKNSDENCAFFLCAVVGQIMQLHIYEQCCRIVEIQSRTGNISIRVGPYRPVELTN